MYVEKIKRLEILAFAYNQLQQLVDALASSGDEGRSKLR